MLCQNPLCPIDFTPKHALQRYHNAGCQKAYKEWARRRGAALLPLVLNRDTNGLEKQREKLIEEINNATTATA